MKKIYFSIIFTLLLVHAGQAQISFTKTDFTQSFGVNTESVAIGDVNGDGFKDAVIICLGSNIVVVFTNTGTGSMVSTASYTTGSAPQTVALGDLNGDGKPDIAVANYSGNTVSVLLNNGTGGFGTKTDYTTGTTASSLAIGDINADGKSDLAVTNQGSASISVFTNTGSGGFSTKRDYSTGSVANSVAIGDLNGDGYGDVAVANNGAGNVSVLINNGSGVFAAAVNYNTGPNSNGVVMADFNGDSKLDLAVVTSANSITILTNTGSGGFVTVAGYATGSNPGMIASGDFNSDGQLDLVTSNASSNTISVLTGTGTGSFGTKIDFATGTQPLFVTAGDLNNDGKTDIITANNGTNNISVFINTTPTYNNALDLNGGLDYVNITNITPYASITNQFTYETWIYHGGVVINKAFLIGDNGFSVQWNGIADGTISAYLVLSVAGAFTMYSTGSIPASTWTHFAYTYNKGQYNFYINGLPFGSGTIPNQNIITPNQVGFGDNPQVVGNVNVSSKIDEVRIWNIALSQADILANYTKKPVSTTTGLVAYYDFDQGIASGNNAGLTTVLDRSSYANNGTLVNGALTGSTSNWVSSGSTIAGVFAFGVTSISGISSSQTVCSGLTIPLSVTVAGSGLNYQWYKNGTSITGATASSLTLTGVTATSAGVYSVAINGVGGNITSSGISLGVGCNNDLAFNGNPNNVSIPYSADLQVGTSTDFTLEAWIKYTGSASDYTGIVARANAVVPFYQLCLVGNRIAAEINSGSMFGVGQGLQGSTTLNDGIWHHVAMVTSRATQNVKLYVDGNVQVNVSNAGVAGDLNASVGYVLGSDRSLGAFLTGAIDEVRIWHTALSQTEIQNNRFRNLNTTVNGLMAYYDFNQGVPGGNNAGLNSLTDKSGLNRSATLNSFSLSGSLSNWVTATGTTTITGAYISSTIITGITSSQTVCSGVTIPLSVTATGTSLTYQWYKNGTSITGATASSFTLTGVTSTNAGIYSVAINGAGGNITSSGISLGVGCNNALNFDGNDDYIYVNQTSSVRNLGISGFTMSAWVYPTNSSSVYSIIRKDGDYNLYINGDKIGAEVWPGGEGTSPFFIQTGSTSIPSNQWTNVSAVWNGTSFVLYVNGVVDPSSLNGSSVSVTDNLTIGRSILFNQDFLGSLDEIYIWNIPLSQADIQANYKKTPFGTIPGMVAYYDFNEGVANGLNATVSSLIDKSGYSNSGTLNNFNLNGTTSNWTGSVVTSSGIFAFVPTSITGITPSQNVCSGVTIPLSVTVLGSSLSYQWYKNGTSITGATASILTLTGITSTSAGVYSIAISGAGGNITSSGISLGVGCNNALYFDGSNSFVSVLSPVNFPIGNQTYTIEAWIKPTSIGNSGIIGWGNYEVSNQVNAFRLSISGGLINYWWGPDLGTPALNLADGNWHHAAVSFDGNIRKIMVDGIVQAQDFPGSHTIPNANNLTIGWTCSTCSTVDDKFYGLIDELRIWNIAISDNDIIANRYKNPTGNETGLVSYYNFDQGIAGGNNLAVTSLLGKTATPNNGILTSFALTGSTSNWVASGTTFTGAYAFAAPTITWITSSLTVCSGMTIPLSVTATGSGLTYQWIKDGVVILGETSSILNLVAVTSTSSGVYSVAISGLGGNTTSSGISLGVGCNNALSFDGTNDAITFGSLPMSGNNARTVEGWVKTSFSGSYQNPFSSGSASNSQSFNIKVTDTGRLGLMGFNDDYYPTTGAILNDGNWHHFAVSYDGTIAKGYVDGNLDWTAPLSLPLPVMQII